MVQPVVISEPKNLFNWDLQSWKVVEMKMIVKPEKNKSIPSNKLFRADEKTPTTLKEMPPWLTWHLTFMFHPFISTVHRQNLKLTTMETLLAMSLNKKWTREFDKCGQ